MIWFNKSTGRLGAKALFLLLLSVLLPLGCGVPIRNLEKEEVSQVDNLKEMMWFLNTVNKEGFAIAAGTGPGDLSEEDFLVLAEAGRRTTWAARRLSEPTLSQGTEFDRLAAELHAKADILNNEARLREGEAAIKAGRALQQTCAACHRLTR